MLCSESAWWAEMQEDFYLTLKVVMLCGVDFPRETLDRFRRNTPGLNVRSQWGCVHWEEWAKNWPLWHTGFHLMGFSLCGYKKLLLLQKKLQRKSAKLSFKAQCQKQDANWWLTGCFCRPQHHSTSVSGVTTFGHLLQHILLIFNHGSFSLLEMFWFKGT